MLEVNIEYDNTTNVNNKYVIVSGSVNFSIYFLNQSGDDSFQNLKTNIRGANVSLNAEVWDEQLFVEMKSTPINFGNEFTIGASKLLSVPFKQYIKLPLTSSQYNIQCLISVVNGQNLSDIYESSTIYCEMMYIT